MLKVVIVDDSFWIQRSLGRLLNAAAGIEVVGCAEDVTGALSLIESAKPDVVVLDVNLLDGDRGIDVLRYVHRHHPRTQVIMLSDWAASTRLRATYLEAGANAFFDKSTEYMEARDWIAALAVHG